MRLIAIRVGSAAILVGLVALVVFQAGGPSARNTPAAATPVVTAPAPGPLAPQAEFAVVVAAISPPPNSAELLLHVVDAQTAASVTNARLTLVSITELS